MIFDDFACERRYIQCKRIQFHRLYSGSPPIEEVLTFIEKVILWKMIFVIDGKSLFREELIGQKLLFEKVFQT